MNYRNKKITQSANGRACTVNSPVCNHDSSTVVWAHSNSQRHGKGMGIKAHDIFGAYACHACHQWLDSGNESRTVKEFYFLQAMEKSLLILVQSGVLK